MIDFSDTVCSLKACRIAVELGLNRYPTTPPLGETDRQRRERRNRERTYLILWIHDRSLALYNDRPWMLPSDVRDVSTPEMAADNECVTQDTIVRNAHYWHEQGFEESRPADVLVSACVRLRCISVSECRLMLCHECANDLPGGVYQHSQRAWPRSTIVARKL